LQLAQTTLTGTARDIGGRVRDIAAQRHHRAHLPAHPPRHPGWTRGLPRRGAQRNKFCATRQFTIL